MPAFYRQDGWRAPALSVESDSCALIEQVGQSEEMPPIFGGCQGKGCLLYDDGSLLRSIFWMSSSQIAISSAFSLVLEATVFSRVFARSSAFVSLVFANDNSSSYFSFNDDSSFAALGNQW